MNFLQAVLRASLLFGIFLCQIHVQPTRDSQAIFSLNNSPGTSPGICSCALSFSGDARNLSSTIATGVTEGCEGSVPILARAANGTMSHSAQIQITLQ
jgi:hypothetical protein